MSLWIFSGKGKPRSTWLDGQEVDCTGSIDLEVPCDEVMGDARGVRAVAEDQKLKLHRVVGR